MTIALHWFRRDFRVRDNTGLYTACAKHDGVTGIFVIDPRWFGVKEKIGAFQLKFWLESLRELEEGLKARNVKLVVRTNADPVAEILKVVKEIGADEVTYNKDYEPDQIAMDMRLEREADKIGVKVSAFKDSVIFEEQEILTGGNSVYSVYSPYKRAVLKKLGDVPPTVLGLPRKATGEVEVKSEKLPTLKSLGYAEVEIDIATGESGALKMLEEFTQGEQLELYRDTRDFPALASTSRFSAHLNAGTLSPRQTMAAAMERGAKASVKKLSAVPGVKADAKSPFHSAKESIEHWISELIWRDFYRMILFNFPRTVKKPFQENYDHITWSSNAGHFKAWCEGKTGYPIIDAAMRQMTTTGFMHNRVRMLTAMFLTKDLDLHWIDGERFFMQWLVDYDQACNVGGWQWSASTGTDAAPYFRIMNPTLQSARYDAAGEYIKRYVPELQAVPTEFIHEPRLMTAELQKQVGCVVGEDYPVPVVDHHEAKEKAIAKFKVRAEK